MSFIAAGVFFLISSNYSIAPLCSAVFSWLSLISESKLSKTLEHDLYSNSHSQFVEGTFALSL